MPWGIASAHSGLIVVADYINRNVQTFTNSGEFVSKWGTGGSGSDGLLQDPANIAVDAFDHVYVADSFNDQIQVFSITGAFLLRWGTEGSEDGEFNAPLGVSIAQDGSIFVADGYNSRVQEFGTTPTAAQGTTWGFIKGKYR